MAPQETVETKSAREVRLAYMRGYSTGRHGGKWPEYQPPYPPDPIVRELMAALKDITDEARTMSGALESDDEWAVALDAQADRSDAAMSAVTKWLGDTDGT